MSRRRQLTTKRLPLVVFLAGLALVAVVSGYVLERYVLGSFVATKAQPAKPPASSQPSAGAKTEITIPPTGVWRVQTGVFNSKQQADTMAQQLKSKGFGSFISGAGSGPFRVLAGLTKTKEAGQKLASSIQKSGFGAPYVSEYKIAVGPYSVALSDAQYTPVFKNVVLTLADQVPQMAAAWDQHINGKTADFKTTATSISTTLTSLSGKLTAAAPPKGAETLHASLKALLDKASQNSADMKQFAEKGGKDLYVRATSSYIDVLETFERFLAQLPK